MSRSSLTQRRLRATLRPSDRVSDVLEVCLPSRAPPPRAHRVCEPRSGHATNATTRPRLEAPAVQAATQCTEPCRLPGRTRGRTKLPENLRRSSIRYAPSQSLSPVARSLPDVLFGDARARELEQTIDSGELWHDPDIPFDSGAFMPGTPCIRRPAVRKIRWGRGLPAPG